MKWIDKYVFFFYFIYLASDYGPFFYWLGGFNLVNMGFQEDLHLILMPLTFGGFKSVAKGFVVIFVVVWWWQRWRGGIPFFPLLVVTLLNL